MLKKVRKARDARAADEANPLLVCSFTTRTLPRTLHRAPSSAPSPHPSHTLRTLRTLSASPTARIPHTLSTPSPRTLSAPSPHPPHPLRPLHPPHPPAPPAPSEPSAPHRTPRALTPLTPCTDHGPHRTGLGMQPPRVNPLDPPSQPAGEEARLPLSRARPHQRRRHFLCRRHPAHHQAQRGKQAGGGRAPRRVPAAVAAGAPGDRVNL